VRYVLTLIAIGALLHAARSFVPGVADHGIGGAALAFGFLLLAAYFAGKLFAIIRLPKLVGYIVAGIVAGPHVLDLVTEQMTVRLGLVNGVAVCLIALTAGGELSFKSFRPLLATIGRLTLWSVVWPGLVVGATLFAVSSFLFLGDLPVGARIAVCALLGVTLCAKSPAVVMALLTETRADGPLSRTILGTVVIADLSVIVLFGVLSAFVHATVGGSADAAGTALGIAWTMFGSMAAGAVVGGLLAVYLRKVKEGVPLFVLLVCVVVAEVAGRLRLDPLIVMLAAGVAVENMTEPEASKLVHELEAASLPVFLVFFAATGTTIHIDLLAEYGPIAGVVVAVRAASFWVGTRVATRRPGVDPVVRKWVFAGLLPQAGLAIALSLLIKHGFPSFGEDASAFVLGVIALNELLMPIVLRHALLASGEAGKRAEVELMGEPAHSDSMPTLVDAPPAEAAGPPAPAILPPPAPPPDPPPDP
jgi:Kef-type K+ transport system membrane component KefB